MRSYLEKASLFVELTLVPDSYTWSSENCRPMVTGELATSVLLGSLRILVGCLTITMSLDAFAMLSQRLVKHASSRDLTFEEECGWLITTLTDLEHDVKMSSNGKTKNGELQSTEHASWTSS